MTEWLLDVALRRAALAREPWSRGRIAATLAFVVLVVVVGSIVALLLLALVMGDGTTGPPS